MTSTFSRRVWEKVKNMAGKKDPENWIIPADNSKITCQFCTKTDIVLMKCCIAGCDQYSCIECAYKAISAERDIGLALYGSTDLRVQCDYHYGNVLYCNCRTSYDAREMVQCDCCEGWFHISCVGFKVSKKNPDGDFTCTICIDLQKPSGAKLSADTCAFLSSHQITSLTPHTSANTDKSKLLGLLKKKIKADDTQFQAQTDAASTLGPLVKLVDKMETLDEIYNAMHVRNEFGGLGDITEEQLSDAMSVFVCPPWSSVVTGGSGAGADNAMDVEGVDAVSPDMNAVNALCDVADLLQEYRIMGQKFGEQLGAWDAAFHRTLKDILGAFASIARAHNVPSVWVKSSASDSEVQMDDSCSVGSTDDPCSTGHAATLFDSELCDKLFSLNNLLQELVGAGGDKRGSTRGYLEARVYAYPLPVKPATFDTYLLIAKAVQKFMDIFEIVRAFIAEGTADVTTGSLLVTYTNLVNMVNNLSRSFANGYLAVHSHLAKDKSVAMGVFSRYDVGNECVDMRKLLYTIYDHLQRMTSNGMEKWTKQVHFLYNYVSEVAPTGKKKKLDVSDLYKTISEGVALPFTVDIIQTLLDIQQKCISTERSVLHLHSSQKSLLSDSDSKGEDDRTIQLRNLYTKANALPFRIPSLEVLTYLMECNAALIRYETITTTHSAELVSKYSILGLWTDSDTQNKNKANLVNSRDIMSTMVEIQDLIGSYEFMAAKCQQIIQANKGLRRRSSSVGGSYDADTNAANIANMNNQPLSFPLVDSISVVCAMLEESLAKLSDMRDDVDQLRMSALQFLNNSPTNAKLGKMLTVLQTSETNSCGLLVKYSTPEEDLIRAILRSGELRQQVLGTLKQLHGSENWAGRSSSHQKEKPDKADLDELDGLLVRCEANLADIRAYDMIADSESETVAVSSGAANRLAPATEAFDSLEAAVLELREVVAELSIHWSALKQLAGAHNGSGTAGGVQSMITQEEFRVLLTTASAQTNVKCDSVLKLCTDLLRAGKEMQDAWVEHLAGNCAQLDAAGDGSGDGDGSGGSYLNNPAVMQTENMIYSAEYCDAIADFHARSLTLPIQSEYKRNIIFRHCCCTLFHQCREVLAQIPSLYVVTSDPQSNTDVYNKFQKNHPIISDVGDLIRPCALGLPSDSKRGSTIMQAVRNCSSDIQTQLVISSPTKHGKQALPSFAKRFLVIAWKLEVSHALLVAPRTAPLGHAEAVKMMKRGRKLVNFESSGPASGNGNDNGVDLSSDDEDEHKSSSVYCCHEWVALRRVLRQAQLAIESMDQALEIYEEKREVSFSILCGLLSSGTDQGQGQTAEAMVIDLTSSPAPKSAHADPRHLHSHSHGGHGASSDHAATDAMLVKLSAGEDEAGLISPNAFVALADAMKCWGAQSQSKLLGGVSDQIKALPISLAGVINTYKVTLPDALASATRVDEAYGMYKLIHEGLVEKRKKDPAGAGGIIEDGVIQFRDMMHLVGSMKKLLEKDSLRGFGLLASLTAALDDVGKRAVSWEIRAQQLLSQRSTRTKTKIVVKSVKKTQLDDLLERECGGLAKVLSINSVHTQLVANLNAANRIHCEFKSFVGTSSDTNSNTNSSESLSELRDIIGLNLEARTDFDQLMRAYVKADDLRTRADLLTFELLETPAIEWTNEVCSWYYSLNGVLQDPPVDINSSSGSGSGSSRSVVRKLSYTDAVTKVKEGQLIFDVELKGAPRGVLDEWGLLRGGLHGQLHLAQCAAEHLRSAECIYIVLTDHIARIAALESETSQILGELESGQFGGGRSESMCMARCKEVYNLLSTGEGLSICQGCSPAVWSRLLKRLDISASSGPHAATGRGNGALGKRKLGKNMHAESDVSESEAEEEDHDQYTVQMLTDETKRSKASKAGKVARTKVSASDSLLGLGTTLSRGLQKCVRPGCQQLVSTGSKSISLPKQQAREAGYCGERCLSTALPEVFAALLCYRDSLGCAPAPAPRNGTESDTEHASSADAPLLRLTLGACGGGGVARTSSLPELQREIAVNAVHAGMKRAISGRTEDKQVLSKVFALCNADSEEPSPVETPPVCLVVHPTSITDHLKAFYPADTLTNVITITAPTSLVSATPAFVTSATQGKTRGPGAGPRAPTPAVAIPRTAIPLEVSRALVRQQLEDSLFSNLVKNSTEPSAAVRCVVLAADIEEVLCSKYMNSTTLELNKKDYQQHCRKIRLNIKEPHNCELIVKLLTGKMAIGELLAMDVDDFASAEDKAQRARYQAIRAKESTRVAAQSTEAILEARRQQAMAGAEEAWRGDSSMDTLDVPIGGAAAKPKSLSTKAAPKLSASSAAAAAEAVSSKSTGNSINIDTSMFNSFSRPEDAETSSSQNEDRTHNKYVLRYNSMLEKDIHASMLTTPVRLLFRDSDPALARGADDSPKLRLVLVHQPKDTGNASRPLKLEISGVCVVRDRRVQGLLPGFPIECKLKAPTAEVNKAIGVAISSKRRIVACFQMIVDKESEDSFHQYAQLYGQVSDRMLAWEVRDGDRHTTLSIVPPSLIQRVDILRGFIKDNNLPPSGVVTGNGPNKGRVILYGIITAKQWGDVSFFQSSDVTVIPFVPAAVVVTASKSKPMKTKTSTGTASSTGTTTNVSAATTNKPVGTGSSFLSSLRK